MKLLDEIKKEIRPDDFVLKEADSFIRIINDLLKKSKVKAKCVKGGSTAKGTFLKGDHDIDLFVIFGSVYRNKDISGILLKILNPLKPDVVHGSRDYFHITKKKMTYEIVPVIEVRNPDDIENVTDMSPHHVKWVNDRLNDALRDDIRLAKKFCKAQKIYGAESYIQGFSGHVIDILIIYYGGFLKLLKAAESWKPKVVIDVEHHFKDPLKNVDSSKTYGPLLIIDPVQPQRNAAAAISQEKFDLFVKASKEFLKNPSKEFFKIKEFDLKTVKKNAKGKTLATLEIEACAGKTDVVGAKLLKIYEHLKKQLALFGFSAVDSGWKWDKKKKTQMYFLIKEKELSKTFVRIGPPLNKKESCTAFKVKHEDVFLKNKRLYANVKRKYRTPKALLTHLIKEDYMKLKADKIRIT